jgi:hypothetical protein
MFESEMRKPRVFLSYSYYDPQSIELQELFVNACNETNCIPVIFSAHVGSNIIQDLRIQLLYSDLIVVVSSRTFTPSLTYEVQYSSAMNLPVLFLVDARNEAFEFRGAQHYLYHSPTEFFSILVNFLNRFKEKFSEREHIEQRERQENVMDIIRTSVRQNVLVLGKDSDNEGLLRINKIMNVLSNNQYNPIKLKDLPDITFLSIEDKMLRVAALCRFIIAEDSRPSGHIDELKICTNCQYITATVREAGTGSTWMQAHYPIQFSFMNRFCYAGQRLAHDSLCSQVFRSIEMATEKAINWAEARIALQEYTFRSGIYSNF